MSTYIRWHYATSLPFLGLLSLVIYFALSLYKARRFFRRLKRDGMPMPPHHPLWGHLGLSISILMRLPRNAMPTVALADQIRIRYPHLNRAFYLDQWPFSPPILMVLDGDLINQFTQETSLPKISGLHGYLKPLSGGHDLLTMEGQQWKYWGGFFRPGFTMRSTLSYIPKLVETIQVFHGLLCERAKDGGLFLLGPMTLSLAMDMAGQAIWNHDLNTQKAPNTMANAIISQLSWLHFAEFSYVKINPVRSFMHWYNQRKMDRYISKFLTQRQEKQLDGDGEVCSVIDTAIEAFHHSKDASRTTSMNGIDIEFDAVLRSQMKFFLLAGYDTTASTIVYVLHLLSRHPKVLACVREEHDRILGRNTEAAPAVICQEPHLLNRLPYTTAVVKEALRLYPPASTVRNGRKGFYIYDRGPKSDRLPSLPTEGCIVFSNHHGLHHNPLFWDRPEEFTPERFLDSQSERQQSPARSSNAWRPFERGPRLCTGQELAMAEIKLVCVLTVRDFDLADAYEEWDLGHGKKLNKKTVRGDRAYQITRGGGSHPSDWYPCRVKLTSRE